MKPKSGLKGFKQGKRDPKAGEGRKRKRENERKGNGGDERRGG